MKSFKKRKKSAKVFWKKKQKFNHKQAVKCSSISFESLASTAIVCHQIRWQRWERRCKKPRKSAYFLLIWAICHFFKKEKKVWVLPAWNQTNFDSSPLGNAWIISILTKEIRFYFWNWKFEIPVKSCFRL